MAHAITTGPSKDLFDSELQQLLKNAEARIKKAQSVVAVDVPHEKRKLAAHLNNPLDTTYSRMSKNTDGPVTQDQSPEVAEPRKPEATATARRKDQKKRKAASAGDDWYNLPRTKLTPTTKRDLQLLQMRNVLDPHRHYRKSDQKGKLPKYSQTGTVMEGPTEYYSARLNRKERTQSLAADLLSGEAAQARFKNKYNEIQAKSASGRKAHYKTLKAKRSRNR